MSHRASLQSFMTQLKWLLGVHCMSIEAGWWLMRPSSWHHWLTSYPAIKSAFSFLHFFFLFLITSALSAAMLPPLKSFCILFHFFPPFSLPSDIHHREGVGKEGGGGGFWKSQQNIVFLASQQWLEIKASKHKKKNKQNTSQHILTRPGTGFVSPPAGPPPPFPVTFARALVLLIVRWDVFFDTPPLHHSTHLLLTQPSAAATASLPPLRCSLGRCARGNRGENAPSCARALRARAAHFELWCWGKWWTAASGESPNGGSARGCVSTLSNTAQCWDSPRNKLQFGG